MKNLLLDHCVREPLKRSGHPPLILMLHGYGADMNDLFHFASRMPDCALVISAQAPHRLSWGGYAWWPFETDPDGLIRRDPDQALKAVEKGQAFIRELEAHFEYDHKKFFLLGFSQGGMMSYGLALSDPDRYAGVMALSSYLIPEFIPSPPTAGYQLPPFFVSHGTQDPVLPIEGAREDRERLKSMGAEIAYHEYAMPHGISPDNFNDLLDWLGQRICS